MLNEPDLRKLASDIFSKNLPEVQLERVVAGSMLDSEGNDAIRMTFVLTPESVDTISGEDAINLLSEIHEQLVNEGDERFPIIEYATAAEMAQRAGFDAETDDDQQD